MRSVPRDQTGLARVTGRVSGAGVPLAGSGYSVTKTAVGGYTVRPINCNGIVSVKATVATSAGAFMSIAISTTDFAAWVTDHAGAQSDQPFSFDVSYRTA